MATPLQETAEGKPALLIVDDDALITDTLAFALDADFQVYACESRSHAIELLRQLPQPPQLALVDLGLPPTPHAPEEGFQLIADLLAHSRSMKIFVHSGQTDAPHAPWTVVEANDLRGAGVRVFQPTVDPIEANLARRQAQPTLVSRAAAAASAMKALRAEIAAKDEATMVEMRAAEEKVRAKKAEPASKSRPAAEVAHA